MEKPLDLTVAQVLALAPDASAAAAGRKLSALSPWKGLARSARAIWGECQGSALYQVRVDLADFVAKCSCPSRKFPCKHAIGLLLLARERVFPGSDEPDWVVSWLAARASAAVRKQSAREPATVTPEKAAAAEKRAARREDRVREGLEALEVWLCDLLRNGLAVLDRESPAFWERQASRLVDAQAGGLASRLRRLSALPGSGANWPERLLDEIGRLALLIEAHRRIDTLESGLQEDVRQLVGFAVAQDDVIAGADAVADRWCVAGQRAEDAERIRVLRTWLRGRTSGRTALVLQFAAGNAPLVPFVIPGTEISAELTFWPSAAPVRAIVKSRSGGATPLADFPGDGSVQALLVDVTETLARQPFGDRWLALLKGVKPVLLESGGLAVADGAGDALPLARGNHHRLLALSGGRTVDLAAEWDGYELAPIGLVSAGRFHPADGRA